MRQRKNTPARSARHTHHRPLAPSVRRGSSSIRLSLIGLSLWATSVAAQSTTWLIGNAFDADGAPVAFSIAGEDRKDPVGGTIGFGAHEYTIERVSIHNLIGAYRTEPLGDDLRTEFVVFSSSFSEQTATGQPWVKAQHYLGCDEPYNAFLAVYTLDSQAKVERLGGVAYGLLTDSTDRSDTATVYCFYAAPPDAAQKTP